jgi:hypothetical protein
MKKSILFFGFLALLFFCPFFFGCSTLLVTSWKNERIPIDQYAMLLIANNTVVKSVDGDDKGWMQVGRTVIALPPGVHTVQTGRTISPSPGQLREVNGAIKFNFQPGERYVLDSWYEGNEIIGGIFSFDVYEELLHISPKTKENLISRFEIAEQELNKTVFFPYDSNELKNYEILGSAKATWKSYRIFHIPQSTESLQKKAVKELSDIVKRKYNLDNLEIRNIFIERSLSPLMFLPVNLWGAIGRLDNYTATAVVLKKKEIDIDNEDD